MLDYKAYNNYKIFLEKHSVEHFKVLREGASDDTQNDQRDQLIALVKEDVERCVALIMGKYKFFGEFIYRFRFLYTYRVKTMATDGRNFFINPRWSNKLSDKAMIFVLCHEILHNVLMHFTRGKNLGIDKTTHRKWNKAADYEENQMLVEEGLCTVEEVHKPPLKGLLKAEYEGMVAEEIFSLLPPSKKKDPSKPKPPKPPKEEFPVTIGSVVKIKDKYVDKYGVIEGINTDDTYEIKEITYDEAKKALNKLKEKGHTLGVIY